MVNERICAFRSVACLRLIFVISADTQLMGLIGDVLKLTCPRPRLLSYGRKSGRKLGRSSVQGIVRRSCSINVDAEQIPGKYFIGTINYICIVKPVFSEMNDDAKCWLKLDLVVCL